MFDTVSIGSATVDIFFKISQSHASSRQFSFPLGAKIDINTGFISSGGGATNSAVAFSRLGLKSACLSLFGREPLSQYILADLRQNQVNTSLLRQSSRQTTDYALILVAPSGSQTILVNRGSTCLQARHIPWKKIQSSRCFYISSLEGNLDLLEKLIGFAKENNIWVSLNPGSREIKKSQTLLPLLCQVNLLLLNQQEAENLISASFSQKNFWSKLKSLGSAYIALTRGRRGAHLLTPADHLFSPVVKRTVVDETGAGDSFGSTLTAALLYQKSPSTALFWAMKNSASVVSRFGAKTALLSLNQIKNKIKVSSLPSR